VAALHSTGLLAMDRAQALPFAAAVCTGIVAWFVTLLWLVRRWRERVSVHTLGRFRRTMGTLLVAAGGWMGLRAVLAALHQ
jgi:hypothetical protein